MINTQNFSLAHGATLDSPKNGNGHTPRKISQQQLSEGENGEYD